MKKFVSLLVIFAVITITYMPFVSAYFVEYDSNIWEEKSVISLNTCCEWWKQEITNTKKVILCNDWWICPDGSICECCLSPLSNYQYLSRSDISSNKQKIKKSKILDFTFIDLFEDSISVNLVSKFNTSPSEFRYFTPSNSYILLTGSVKSNC